jgi:hypothetical protein
MKDLKPGRVVLFSGRRLVLLFFVCMAGLNASCRENPAQAVLYVSPGGIGQAFTEATPGDLYDVRAKVRSMNRDMNGDIVVLLKRGWYSLDRTFTLGASDGGFNGFDVVFRAEEGGRVVLSGGRPVTGWTLHDAAGNIWKAAAPPGAGNRQLYVNCVRAVRAHRGSGLRRATRTAAGYRVLDDDLMNWKNPADAEFLFNALKGGTGGSQWTERRVGVASVSSGLIAMKQPAWGNATAGDAYQAVTYPTDIENAYELLDEPGEWYLDGAARTIYYIPRHGEDMATAVVIAPVLETLVSVTGTPDAPVRRIRFEGLTFAHATIHRPSGNEGWPEIQANHVAGRNDGSGRTPGNVSCRSVANLRFERCIFKHLGGVGLDLSGGARDNTIIGCVFTDISGTCLQLGSTTDPDRADLRARDSGNRITDNYIHDAPCEFRGGVGVFCGYVSDLLFSHNEIGRTPYSAVSVGWGWGTDSYARNNLLASNDFYLYCRDLADGGAIYSLSAQPNSSWHRNFAHDVPNGRKPMWRAWYTDEGSAFIDIHHNVTARIAGADWYSAWTPTIHDNRIHDNFTDTNNFTNAGTRCEMDGNVLVKGDSWPMEAVEVMESAGLESDYRPIRSSACACSLLTLADGPVIPPAAAAVEFFRNFPNPFPYSTIFEYSLPEDDHVVLEVYDLRGRRIRALFDGDERMGRHRAVWDGLDGRGFRAASGVYLCRFSAKRMNKVVKLTLLR